MICRQASHCTARPGRRTLSPANRVTFSGSRRCTQPVRSREAVRYAPGTSMTTVPQLQGNERRRRWRSAVGTQDRSSGSAAPGAAGIDSCLQLCRLVVRPRGLGAVSRGAALRGPRSGRPCSQKCNQDLFEEHHRVNERRDAAGVMHGPAPASPADGGAGQCMCAFSAQLS